MKLTIYGKPIPKARARHSSRGKYVVTYDPQDKDKKQVSKEIAEQLRTAINSLDKDILNDASNICLGKVFCVSFNFYLPINQSDSIGERNAKLWGLVPHVTKPDYDNLEKFYLDCMTGIIWSDDSLIVDAEAHKHYSDEPRVEIEIQVKQLPKLSEPEEKVIKMLSPKEMKEFLHDCANLAFIKKYTNFERIDTCDEHELRDIIFKLNTFALKYANTLKKVEKLGDLSAQFLERNNLITEIDEGKHAIAG